MRVGRANGQFLPLTKRQHHKTTIFEGRCYVATAYLLLFPEQQQPKEAIIFFWNVSLLPSISSYPEQQRQGKTMATNLATQHCLPSPDFSHYLCFLRRLDRSHIQNED